MDKNMSDSNNNQSESQSLFGQKDILHDIETVQAKWEREHKRRRALMIKIFIVGGIFLALAIGSVIYKIHRINQIRLSFEEKAAKRYLPIGYREAKIRIFAYESEAYESVEDILREAVDNMPSEFYIQFRTLAGVDGEEVENALGKFRPGISINGQYKFTIKDGSGNEKEIELVENPGQKFRLNDLAAIINQVHKEVYGDRYLRPVNTYSEMRVQAIPIDDDDESENNQAAQIDNPDENDAPPDDIIPRTKISPEELKVPKFDAKEIKKP